MTYGIGDWVPYNTKTPTDYTSTCFYYYDNVLMARFAELLGRDGERYVRKAEQLRELINTKYYDAEKGLYANGSQAAQGVALYLGLVPCRRVQRVADNLDRMIAENNYFLDFGTIGSKTVLRMLTRYGHVETAYRMASQTEAPSWGWWVSQGFTTLAETWTLSPYGTTPRSTTSSWATSPRGMSTTWRHQFRSADPGFGHIVIAPHFVGALDWAAASYDSVRGEIRSEWRRSGGRVTLKVTVPANTTADIRIDGETVATVGGGVHEYTF